MIALLIIVVGGVLAWLYTRAVSRMSGEQVMGVGVLLIVPYAVILIGVIVALVVLT